MHVQSCWFSQRTYCFLFSFPWNRCRGWVNSLIWGLSKHDVHSTENGLGKNALFRLAHFVKCWRFFLPLNSWGLFPGSEKERKIRRHTFTFFVKRCRIHVIVRKSVMHVHGCCFAPKTFYYYYYFFTLSLLSSWYSRELLDIDVDGWGTVIPSLTWQQSPWFPVSSIPPQSLAAKGSGGRGGLALSFVFFPFSVFSYSSIPAVLSLSFSPSLPLFSSHATSFFSATVVSS